MLGMPESPSSRCASIDALPDALFGRIFAHAGREAGVRPGVRVVVGTPAAAATATPLGADSMPPCRPSLQATITLVCRRWQDVFYSEPALWRELSLLAESLDEAEEAGQAAHWFAAKTCLLQRVGGFVQHLHYSELVGTGGDEPEPLQVQQLAVRAGSSWRLSSSVLGQLSPASLQTLWLQGGPVDVAACFALQRFTGLLDLSIECCEPMPDCIALVLHSLPRVRQLSLIGGTQPAGLPEALRHLPQLTRLDVGSNAHLWDMSVLFPLTQLRAFGWQDQQPSGKLRPDMQLLLAQLPCLESWSISSFRADDEGAGCLQVGAL